MDKNMRSDALVPLPIDTAITEVKTLNRLADLAFSVDGAPSFELGL